MFGRLVGVLYEGDTLIYQGETVTVAEIDNGSAAVRLRRPNGEWVESPTHHTPGFVFVSEMEYGPNGAPIGWSGLEAYDRHINSRVESLRRQLEESGVDTSRL